LCARLASELAAQTNFWRVGEFWIYIPNLSLGTAPENSRSLGLSAANSNLSNLSSQ
jgi:hypothetical protein